MTKESDKIEMKPCPHCDGYGGVPIQVGEEDIDLEPCSFCQTGGEVTKTEYIQYKLNNP